MPRRPVRRQVASKSRPNRRTWAIPFGALEAHIPQLASVEAVRPLARVAVVPDDFPFLAQVRGHEDERLEEYTRAMETGGPWPEPSS